jgi:peroxiredoxin
VKAGDIAPNFILKDQDGKNFELYKNLSQKILLIFYPKDYTPVCSSQLAEYNDNIEEIIQAGIKPIGISSDSTKSHAEFCSKLNLEFPLLTDEDKTVSKLYNAINIIGMRKRHLVLVGTDKKVLWEQSIIPLNYIKSGEILKKVKLLNMKEMT